MKKLLASALVALTVSACFASVKKWTAPDKQVGVELKLGDQCYAESYFYTAAEHYKDVVRQDSTNRYGCFWLAMSLLQARDYENAEVFFRKFYSIKPGEKTNAKRWALEDELLFNKGEYYYGEVLHRNGKYNEAIEHLGKFSKNYVPKDINDNLKKLAVLEIAGCEFAEKATPARVKIFNLGPSINKSYNEGAPAQAGDHDLYYSSAKTQGASDTLVFVDGPKPLPMYQLMHATKEGPRSWGKGKAVDNPDINTPGYNVGNGAFNGSQSRFYFTKCLDMEDDRSLCNLYVADYSDGKFSNVKRLPEPVNTKEKYTTTQPAVRNADDGSEIIYFSTDRPGGAGGMDIWYTIRLQSGDYKEPKPVVGPVNTPGDEVTPFFDDNTKTLYFSSNGLPGFGGYDIFKSTENPDLSWSAPVNMGMPINTGADDLYYTLNSDKASGYLASNREGSVPLNGIKTASDDLFYWSNLRFAVEGFAFKDDAGGGPLAGAIFNLYKIGKSGDPVLIAIDSTSALGRLGTMGEGSYFFNLSPETDYEVQVTHAGYKSKSERTTTKGLPGEDTIKLNLLVGKSATTAKGKVIEEGKGTEVLNANVELIEVSPGGLQKTVNYMRSNPYYYFDVELNKTYKLVTRKEGYFANTTELVTGANAVDTIRKDITITKLELNKAYTLDNVLYEFDKADLTEGSKTVLDNLYQIMVENPAFVIELSAHTDSKGADEYNMKLSQARAQSCVNYLEQKGISKDRLVAKGYGKTRPKVPNTTPEGKDDPAGRAINRRTEFQIIGVKKEQ